jgi:multiple sugar transport system ATP-binding protein
MTIAASRSTSQWWRTLSGLSDDEQLTAQQIVGRISSRTPPQRGSQVRLAVDPDHVHVFSQKTGDRLSA